MARKAGMYTYGGGDEKDLSSKLLLEEYSPEYVEAERESWWEKEGYLKGGYLKKTEGDCKTKFVTVLSPRPNETNQNLLQDVIIRWHRMKGDNILSIPRFLDQTCADLKSSPEYSKVVTEAFIQLHEKGFIYRQYKFVNWSCALKCNISEIEIDKLHLTGSTLLSIPGYEDQIEFGVLVRFAYRIDDSDEKIEVATTRIETMLGDSAIAVHPEDERYKHLIGKTAKHPFCDRKLKIIADDSVDKDLGTGARKIAPSHYPDDYEIAVRHNVQDYIPVFSDDGNIFDPVWMDNGKFNGMKRFNARKAIIEELKALGLYLGTEDCPMVLSICSKTKDVVEPMYKANWYLKCYKETMADIAKSGDVEIMPRSIKLEDGVEDWCISRESKEGLAVPAYYVRLNNRCSGKPLAGTEANAHRISGSSRQEVLTKAATRYRTTIDHVILREDEDVLDPFFSTIVAWLNDTKDFNPKMFVGTRKDIWWISKILVLGKKLHEQLVFDQVCFLEKPNDVLTGLVTGQSDGMDALRFSVCSGRDLMDSKSFCAKIWIAARTALSYFGEDFEAPHSNELSGEERDKDMWILNRLASAVSDANQGFERCDFAATSSAIYNFWFLELCDVYLDHLKLVFASEDAVAKKTAQATLYKVLDVGLRLLSPLMPFISEELYQRLPGAKEAFPSILVAPYPG